VNEKDKPFYNDDGSYWMKDGYRDRARHGRCQSCLCLYHEYDKEVGLAKKLTGSLTIRNGWFIVTPRILHVVVRHLHKMESLRDLFAEVQKIRYYRNETEIHKYHHRETQ